MPRIKPFSGYIYNIKKIKEINKVVAPPWDVIDENYEKFLLQNSPYNIVNLISKNAEPSCVKKTFENWIKNKIFIKDKKESFYFLNHTFICGEEKKERKGFFALLEIEELNSKKVIPHEVIFEKHRDNRYRLIEKCHANFSSVFMLYQDKKNIIEKIINSYSKILFEGEINDEKFKFGIINSGEKEIKKVIGSSKLFIADGHHRYNAALNFYKNTGLKKYKYVLVYLSNIDSPDLVILPTHRYIKEIPDIKNKQKELSNFFEIIKVSNEKEMFKRMKTEKQNQYKFGVYDGNFYVLVLKKREEVISNIHSKNSNLWKSLDVVILHEFILKKIFEVSGEVFMYNQNPKILIEERNKIGKGIVFFINPITKQSFKKIVSKGELMPQKSTYFYPKVPSGLVIYKF